ncbi:MAG: hypothetical protein LBH29_01900 [Elusimicrobiota bacterium]|jgi:predicted MPP superfamily phosphohydrolase|nr:hypothetical protein [Elusimicrobiota bacterium]
MQKKWMLFLPFLLMFLFSETPLSAASPLGDLFSADANMQAEKALLEKIKKENGEFHKKLLVLLNKRFYSASKAEKENLYSQIKALIAQQTDSEIENNKKFISMQSERLRKIENRVKEIEKNKRNYVEEKTDYFIEGYDAGKSANPS